GTDRVDEKEIHISSRVRPRPICRSNFTALRCGEILTTLKHTSDRECVRGRLVDVAGAKLGDDIAVKNRMGISAGDPRSLHPECWGEALAVADMAKAKRRKHICHGGSAPRSDGRPKRASSG